MKAKNVLPYLLSGVVLVACGGADNEEQRNKDFEDAVTALSALGGAAAGAMEADEALNKEDENDAAEKTRNDLIHYKDLRAALPDEIAGAEKVDEDGEMVKMGAYSLSTAKKVYKNDDKEITIEILDYALAAGMLKMASAMGTMEMESDDEYIKSFRLDDTVSGWENFNKNTNESEASAVINNRLMVIVTVENADPGESVEILKELDDLNDLIKD